MDVSGAAQQPAWEVTALLKRVREGNPDAESDLFRAVYSELRRLAKRALRNERPDHTLQPTALVHEAYIRLLGGGSIDWVDRQHFFSTAARTMRRILIDYARHQRAKKKDLGQRVDLEYAFVFTDAKSDALLALDQALDTLELRQPRQCKVVELRFFAGLSIEETAEVMGLSAKTVMRDWKMARAWLHGEIHD